MDTHGPSGLACLAAVLLLAAATAPAYAHGDSTHLTLEANEGDACDGDDNFCYEVLTGDPANVAAGASVELTLENPSSNSVQHNTHVTDTNAANKGQSTSAGAAFASVNTIDPGESSSTNFTVPSDVDGTYLWCTIGSHESGGMWLLGGAAAESTDGGDGGTDDGNGSPGFGAASAVVAAGAALALTRRD